MKFERFYRLKLVTFCLFSERHHLLSFSNECLTLVRILKVIINLFLQMTTLNMMMTLTGKTDRISIVLFPSLQALTVIDWT